MGRNDSQFDLRMFFRWSVVKPLCTHILSKTHIKHFWKQAQIAPKRKGSELPTIFSRACVSLFQAFPFRAAVALKKIVVETQTILTAPSFSCLRGVSTSPASTTVVASAPYQTPRSCDLIWWWGAKNGVWEFSFSKDPSFSSHQLSKKGAPFCCKFNIIYF